MQLIMESEPAADIMDKMTTFEDTLSENLKDPIESIKNEISNGNKENIESQKNIIECIVDAVNGDVLKHSEESSETLITPESVQVVNNIDDNIDVTNGDAIDNENISETTNGESLCVPSEEEAIKLIAEKGVLENIGIEKNKVEAGEKDQEEMGVVENITDGEKDQEDTCLEEIENTSLSNNEDSLMDIECVNSESEEVILEPAVDDHVDAEIGTLKDLGDITENDTISQNDDLMATEFEETKNHEIIEDMVVLDNSLEEIKENDAVIDDFEIIDAQSEEITEDDTISKAIDVLDSETEQTQSMEENSKAKEILNIDSENKNSADTIEKSGNTSDSPKVDQVSNMLETSLPQEDTSQELDIIPEIDSNEDVMDCDATELTQDETKGDEKISESDQTLKDTTEHPIEQTDNQNIQDPDQSVVIKPTESADNQKVLDVDESISDTDKVDKEHIQDTEVDAVDSSPVEIDVDEFLKDMGEVVEEPIEDPKVQELVPPAVAAVPKKTFCKLSNTLDILSDDDEETPQPEVKDSVVEASSPKPIETEKQCINIEDDDDIMLIDEEPDTKDSKGELAQQPETEANKNDTIDECTIDLENSIENADAIKKPDETLPNVQTDVPVPENETEIDTQLTIEEKPEEKEMNKEEKPLKPLIAENFLKGFKKNLADMTRDELEEFCIVKIVEGIVDRSHLSDIKSKLKTMAQNIDEYKKKAMMLTKQNRDLQLVLKSVQEEQKKKTDTAIVPLKITRSVGMQVLMTEKTITRKKVNPNAPNNTNSSVNNSNKVNNNRTPNQSPRPQKPAANNQQIPVPRLVPAATNPAAKAPNAISQGNANSVGKNVNQAGVNGLKATSPAQKTAEKRTHSRASSVTVDLTDDEPPPKMPVPTRSSPAPPVRIVSPHNLMARPQFTQALNSPRKVYIPISGPQGQNIRPGQTIMLKSVPPPGQRLRGPAPHTARMPQNQVRLTRVTNNRHPAPLPECMKQYQPPNWKALPPAPDLKLSKVENGIVISWKIEGYQEDSYEDIASYQLYAYQETSSPPNTALWKKIGDVKALPLPMACTLTQFMAGFKYYFAVRAVDVRSRLGPFSLPGSILLLNKM